MLGCEGFLTSGSTKRPAHP